MALGASNTAGVHSKPEDGYRKALRNILRNEGYPVNMVGSQSNPTGSMKNGAHEGYPGERISGVTDKMKSNGYLDRKPNIVLVHAGTNNCLQNNDVNNGADQLGDLANYIIEQVGGVAVVMSTLPPLKQSASGNASCQNTLNPAIRRKAAELRLQGKNVWLTDIGGPGPISANDINNDDGVHFTDAGYRKVASMWADTIDFLDRQGAIPIPVNTQYPDKDDAGDSTTCKKHAGDAYGSIQTQFGVAGADDGPYSHSGDDKGYLSFGSTNGNSLAGRTGAGQGIHPEDWFFAQIIKVDPNADRDDVREDLVFYSRHSSGQKLVARVYVNKLADGTIEPEPLTLDIDDGDGCLTRGVRWGDVNNDGLDDYICIGAEGNMYVSYNRGGSPPKFESAGQYMTVPAGHSQKNVLIGDIDGDGRVDYCVTADNGDIHCWRNAGVGDAHHWIDIGIVFQGKGMGDITGTRLVDINGDHRSDWIWMYDDTGKTRIFTNSRGRFLGLEPCWQEATTAHAGLGIANARAETKFGRIYNRKGHGPEYIHIESSTVITTFYQFHVWQNNGAGGTKMKADGNRYCDMTGKGRDDLLWIWSTGRVQYWSNDNTNGYKSSPWSWGAPIDIFKASDFTGRYPDGFDRRNPTKVIADAVLLCRDGDGKCDILYQPPHASRDVFWWRNNYADGKWGFSFEGFAVNCNLETGVGEFDLAVRFADIDGDGYADALCMEPNGRTSAYSNLPGGLKDWGQIKISEGHERANHRWADVDGCDGRADFLWVDDVNGDTDVWHNDGPVADRVSGSSFKWTSQGKRYQGQVRGSNQYYPDLDGNKRADLLHINPLTNIGHTLFNRCVGGGSGQDDDDPNPNEVPLPVCQPDYCDWNTCNDPPDDGSAKRSIEKRGNPRDYIVRGLTALFIIRSLGYPNATQYLDATPAGPAHNLYYTAARECVDTDIQTSSADNSTGGRLNPLPREWETAQVDHALDLQVMSIFLSYAVTGQRLNGQHTSLPTLSEQLLTDTWNNATGLPPGGTSQKINDVVFNAMGSNTNVPNFVPLRYDINSVKGIIFGLGTPYSPDGFRAIVRRARAGSVTDYEHIQTLFHTLFAIFNYINDPEILNRINNVARDVRTALAFVQQHNLQWQTSGIVALWDEFIGDFFQAVVDNSHGWAEGALSVVSEAFQDDADPNAQVMLRLVSLLHDQLLEVIRIIGHANPK
ncbi:hypothetical protein LTR53_010855 [Teratosphaeriaceae sp. CCFEE 6253]|nr:hypothetical protein LTR53_010855 [Teratosphaeriaceae sp. CCFEE 6253]